MKLQTPILITGASGFVGANLLKRLTKEVPSQKVHVLLRKNSHTWRINDVLNKVSVHIVDLRNQSTTNKLLQKIKPKIIFHLATYGAYPHQLDEKEITNTNILCTFNLMQACTKIDIDAFVNTGSSSEYGINKKPMSENDKLIPITTYGTSKAWATLYGNYLSYTKKVPIITLRLFGVYGFYEPQGRLIPNVILSLLKKNRTTITSPHFTRDFVFISDVVDAYLKAATHQGSKSIFNIGSGKYTALKEIFYLVQDILKVDVDPIWGTNANNLPDINSRIADIKLAKKYLGWKPNTNLIDGLQQTVVWFKKNIPLYT